MAFQKRPPYAEASAKDLENRLKTLTLLDTVKSETRMGHNMIEIAPGYGGSREERLLALKAEYNELAGKSLEKAETHDYLSGLLEELKEELLVVKKQKAEDLKTRMKEINTQMDSLKKEIEDIEKKMEELNKMALEGNY